MIYPRTAPRYYGSTETVASLHRLAKDPLPPPRAHLCVRAVRQSGVLNRLRLEGRGINNGLHGEGPSRTSLNYLLRTYPTSFSLLQLSTRLLSCAKCYILRKGHSPYSSCFRTKSCWVLVRCSGARRIGELAQNR